ncbi:MAG: SDR family NAD(P)-dependent oxidoreductase [Candidatus Ranarchaeia archaeon]
MMSRFPHQTVVVTGAAQGIGLEIANAFAKQGFRLALIDVQKTKLSSAYDKLRQATQNKEIYFFELDITRAPKVKQVFTKISRLLGPVHTLVNNAGIHQEGSFLELQHGEWDRVLSINLKGAFLCSQAAAQSMIENKVQGTIVNIGSIAGLVAIGNNAAYASSKAALIQFTRNLAIELAPYNITVNVVNPGAVATPMIKKIFEDPVIREANLKRIPLRRLAQPNEIAEVVLFLASSSARYITGASINVDGGWTAQGL